MGRNLINSCLLLVCVLGLIAEPSVKRVISGQIIKGTAENGRVIPAPFAEVSIKNQKDGINVTIRSNGRGYFRSNLEDGKYSVSTVNPIFRIISGAAPKTSSGYCQVFTVRVAGNQPKRKLRSGLSKKESAGQGINREIEKMVWDTQRRMNRKLPGSEPLVAIRASIDTVFVGEPLIISLSAGDGDGLDEIWWYATFSKSKALSQKHVYKCDGKRQVDHDWEISIDKPGRVILTADATDIHYGDGSSMEAHRHSDVKQLQEVSIWVKPRK